MPQPNGQLSTSRYALTVVGRHRTAAGREIPYLVTPRRPVDAPVQSSHVVAEGDRLDLIAHAAYGDPTQFWRICDHARVLWPEDLTARTGRRLDIPSAFETSS